MPADHLSPWASAAEIAEAVRSRRTTARRVAEDFLSRIDALNPDVNAFTNVTAERALEEAGRVDALLDAGEDPGSLAGVPYSVKNLFDIQGVVTRAGSRTTEDRPPAREDAVLIRRMRAAGAVLTGALNMGEFAYDFTGENAHDGPCRNPHDLTRMAGGSSSGSAAATAAGLSPISLGTDTNGSLRVPASLCGIFSLKPTYGRLPRTGTFAFVDSLDHVGPLARTVEDLRLAYDVLKGPDANDRSTWAAPEPAADVSTLRVGTPIGWLEANMGDAALAALDTVSDALQRLGATSRKVSLDGAEAGRSAAFLITNAESASLHLDRLRTRADDFDRDTRDRFLAGALLPAAWLVRAQRVRALWLAQALDLFGEIDILLVPATPFSAPCIGDRTIRLAGRDAPLRPNLGLLSQPFSCIGLPVVTAPVFSPGEMPIGVQIIARPWAEATALRVAEMLELSGCCVANTPKEAAQASAI